MRRLILLLFICISAKAIAQLPAVLQWQRNYGGSGEDVGTDIIALSEFICELL